MNAAGEALPAGGRIAAFDIPSGPGVRVDTFGYSGYRTGAAFDSLIAKLIVHSPSEDFGAAVAKPARARRVSYRRRRHQHILPAGVADTSDFAANRIDTASSRRISPNSSLPRHRSTTSLLFRGGVGGCALRPCDRPCGAGRHVSPFPRRCSGTIVSVDVADGALVARPADRRARSHENGASGNGPLRRRGARDPWAQGRHALQGARSILFVEPADVGADEESAAEAIDLDAIRPDLADVFARQAFGLDENRAEAVAKRRKTNHRTARENIAALVDDGSFIEYGSLAIAAQAARRTKTISSATRPATAWWPAWRRSMAICSRPIAREPWWSPTTTWFSRARRGSAITRSRTVSSPSPSASAIPLVLFAEGGGGRPGDTERLGVTGLDVPTARNSPSSAASCLSSASCRVAALPAMPPCSAAATW